MLIVFSNNNFIINSYYFSIAPAPLPEVDPFAPLSLQTYFHGCISRADAEAAIHQDGEFLVRESTNKPGQFVLTGLANGRPQHLLLIDKSGKVSPTQRFTNYYLLFR